MACSRNDTSIREVPATEISLDKNELTLEIGSSESLIASVEPSNTTDMVIWSSSDNSVATVQDGSVVAIGSGSAMIIAQAGNVKAECFVTVIKPLSKPDAIDMGLSVKWASFNLGASKPEEYGDYYTWGETETYYSSLNPLTWKEGKESGYSLSSYKWCMGSSSSLTKYCNNSSYGDNGFIDGKTVLDPEDDAAYVNL